MYILNMSCQSSPLYQDDYPSLLRASRHDFTAQPVDEHHSLTAARPLSLRSSLPVDHQPSPVVIRLLHLWPPPPLTSFLLQGWSIPARHT